MDQIARNKVVDEIDKRTRERKTFVDLDALDRDSQDRDVLDREDEDACLRKDPFDLVHPPDPVTRLDIERRTEFLNKQERNLLDLHRGGHNHEQVANLLGITIHAAESRWRRLCEKLRKNNPAATGK